MALSFVGSGTAASGGIEATASMTLPAGIAENDIVHVAASSNQTTDRNMSMATSGYTELMDAFQDDTSNNNFAVFRKIMGATPDSTAEYNAPASSTDSVCAFHCWRGCDTTTPEDATTVQAGTINSGTPDPGSITTVTAGAVVLALAGSSEADAVTNAPTNYENLVDLQGSNMNVMIASRTIASPGAQDPPTFADVVGTGSDCWNAATVAIRPAAVVGGGGFRSRIAGGFVRS